MTLLKKPGASLLLVGIVMFFLGTPLVSTLGWLGRPLVPVCFVVGILGMVGGAYLLARSTFGPGK